MTRLLCHYLARTAFTALLVSAAALAQAESASGPLDGRSFEGVVLDKGKTRGDADTLIFKNGLFRSTACDPYGFNEAPYKVVADGNAMRFEAETESPKHGKLQWSGYVRGDKVDATATWVRAGKEPVDRWYVGGLQR